MVDGDRPAADGLSLCTPATIHPHIPESRGDAMADKGPVRRPSWLRSVVGYGLNRLRRRGAAPAPVSGAAVVAAALPVVERLRAMQHDFEGATVRLGVIGESGSGKSSLINAIVGQEVAPVGA